jgi:photosystem II stability/assembly factor-like uncharacterized protein
MIKPNLAFHVLCKKVKGQNQWWTIPLIFTVFFNLFIFECIWAEENNDILFAVHQPLVEKSLLLDIVKTENANFVAVGERGHIIYSSDDGKTWTQATVPTRSTLTSIFFINDKRGWAVGHDAIILTTFDGGKSWARQFFAPEKEQPFMDVWFQTPQKGIAVGAYGMYLDTEDGGDTWNEKYFETLDDPDFGLPHFNSIEFTNEDVLYMAGEAGFLARSNNMGASWAALDRPYNGSYFNLLITKNNMMAPSGLRGNIWLSEDQSASWKKLETGNVASVNCGIQLSSGDLFFVCMDGVTVHCKKDGSNCKVNLRSDRVALSSVAELTPHHLIVVGEKGVLHIGLDGKDIK